MAGEINLQVVADIAQAKTQLAELSASIKGIERTTGETKRQASQLGKEFDKAGKAFMGLSKGSVVLAGAMAIKWAVAQAIKYEEALVKIAVRQREMQLGLLQFTQLAPKALDPAKAAAFAEGLMTYGVGRGFNPEQTQQIAGAALSGVRRRSPEEQLAVARRALDLAGAGVDPAEAAKLARRRGPRAEEDVNRAQSRASYATSSRGGLALAERNARARAGIDYQRLMPPTAWATREMEEAANLEYEEMKRKGGAQRRGLGGLGDDYRLGSREELAGTIGSGLIVEGANMPEEEGYTESQDAFRDLINAARHQTLAADNIWKSTRNTRE